MTRAPIDDEKMDDPAILVAILMAARRIGDEMLLDAADTALANQGIHVVFDDTGTTDAPRAPVTT